MKKRKKLRYVSFSSRLEAERLKERQDMMKELEAMKEAAKLQMVQQKTTYEDKLRSLEGALVSGRG